MKSDSAKCLKDREVTLFYDTAGGANVGSATTDAAGNWEIPGSFTQGLYHVEVSKETLGKVRVKRICKAGKSTPRQA